jgi:hypothetical protein
MHNFKYIGKHDYHNLSGDSFAKEALSSNQITDIKIVLENKRYTLSRKGEDI